MEHRAGQSVPSFPSQVPPPSASPDAGISTPTSTQQAAFSAFRRPGRPSDGVVASNPQVLQGLGQAQRQSQVNPSLAREVHAGADGSVYLVPGDGTLCLVSVGGVGVTVGCTRDDDAARNGMVFTMTTSDSMVVRGVYPDGTTRVEVVDDAGRATPVALGPDNGFWISVHRAAAISRRSADGAVHRDAVVSAAVSH